MALSSTARHPHQCPLQAVTVRPRGGGITAALWEPPGWLCWRDADSPSGIRARGGLGARRATRNDKDSHVVAKLPAGEGDDVVEDAVWQVLEARAVSCA